MISPNSNHFNKPLAKVLLISALILISPLGCQKKPAITTLDGETMGTHYLIKLRNTQFEPETLKNKIDTMLVEFNQIMSTYIPDSELMRLNQTEPQQWLPVSESLFHILETALEISQNTNGAFDVTIGKSGQNWGFGTEYVSPTHLLEKNKISEPVKQHHSLIELDSNTRSVKKNHSEVFIDLSGIAKGRAVDMIAEYLLAENITHFMVEIGGEIRANGNKGLDTAWQIGIEEPTIHTRKIHTIIPLKNTSMASSGDYRNFTEIGGQRYSHLIDPKTGRPINHLLTAATVIHKSAMHADAYATALMIMGVTSGLAFANQNNLAVLLIERGEDGFETYYSNTW